MPGRRDAATIRRASENALNIIYLLPNPAASGPPGQITTILLTHRMGDNLEKTQLEMVTL